MNQNGKVVQIDFYRHRKHQEELQRKRLLHLLNDIANMELTTEKREVLNHGLETIRKD